MCSLDVDGMKSRRQLSSRVSAINLIDVPHIELISLNARKVLSHTFGGYESFSKIFAIRIVVDRFMPANLILIFSTLSHDKYRERLTRAHNGV